MPNFFDINSIFFSLWGYSMSYLEFFGVAERLLDIRSSGIARHTQCCVVVLEFHPDPPAKDAQCRKIARKTRSALDLHQHA